MESQKKHVFSAESQKQTPYSRPSYMQIQSERMGGWVNFLVYALWQEAPKLVYAF